MSRMRDSEDMLAEGEWDDCACFVKYYTFHPVQVVTKLMVHVFTVLVVTHGKIQGSLIQ